jgi:hypothetical protein
MVLRSERIWSAVREPKAKSPPWAFFIDFERFLCRDFTARRANTPLRLLESAHIARFHIVNLWSRANAMAWVRDQTPSLSKTFEA